MSQLLCPLVKSDVYFIHTEKSRESFNPFQKGVSRKNKNQPFNLFVKSNVKGLGSKTSINNDPENRITSDRHGQVYFIG